MKVVFVTNGNLFHQAYLSSCISKLPDIEYLCILSAPHGGNEQKARFASRIHFDFKILDANESKTNWDLARNAIRNADLCIVGAENHKILKGIDRVYLRYSEHFFRNKLWPLNPKTYLRLPRMLLRYKKEAKKSWLLCASSHTRFDFNFYGLYRNKCLKFGYFPKANVGINLDSKIIPSSKNEQLKILFAGRSLHLKHPNVAFYVLERLRRLGLNCTLTFVSLPNKFRDHVLSKNSRLIEDGVVTVIDELPPQQLMELMSASHIFVFSSDNGEGFGATLYEAMSSKMAVIANGNAGGTGLLVRDKETGFVYKSKGQLDEIIQAIAADQEILQRVAQNAKQFIEDKYSASVAAKNLVEFGKSGYTKHFPSPEPLSKI